MEQNPVWLHLKNDKTSLTLRIMVCNLCAKFHDPFRIPGDLILQWYMILALTRYSRAHNQVLHQNVNMIPDSSNYCNINTIDILVMCANFHL